MTKAAKLTTNCVFVIELNLPQYYLIAQEPLCVFRWFHVICHCTLYFYEIKNLYISDKCTFSLQTTILHSLKFVRRFMQTSYAIWCKFCFWAILF